MRQPDNLPAFCRVHRNGRPLIGMSGCSQRVIALALSLLAPCGSPGCAEEDMGRRGSAAALRMSAVRAGRGCLAGRVV